MNKKFIVRLSVEERQQLESLIARGKSAARKLARARILLKADCSDLGPAWSDEQISVALDLGPITVHRVRRSCPRFRISYVSAFPTLADQLRSEDRGFQGIRAKTPAFPQHRNVDVPALPAFSSWSFASTETRFNLSRARVGVDSFPDPVVKPDWMAKRHSILEGKPQGLRWRARLATIRHLKRQRPLPVHRS